MRRENVTKFTRFVVSVDVACAFPKLDAPTLLSCSRTRTKKMPGVPASPVLPLFWDLASIDKHKRLTAATSLVVVLTEADAGEPASSDLMSYAVRRLVRGLSSSRDGARQG